MTTILIVEDDDTVCETLALNLRSEGYEVHTAGDGELGLELARAINPDLVVLDVMLPNLDGLTVCRLLRKVTLAFKKRDEKLAYAIACQDEVMDEGYRGLFHEVMGMMGQDSGHAASGLYLLFVGHNLERIADRVTNLAERVIFLSSGKIKELNPESGESAWN
jgi:CheY-like chemotaxis protein